MQLKVHPKLQRFIEFIWKKRTLYVGLGMLIAFAIIFLVIATPLNVLLPGYLDVNKRAVVMDCMMRIDSLEQECNLRVAYLENMTAILRDRVKTEIVPYDSAVSRIEDTLLTASERETRFVERYDRRERFGLNALADEKNGRIALVFLAPVKGRIVPHEHEDGMKLETTRVELNGVVPVLAPQEGTVVSIMSLPVEGYRVMVQHKQDYLTIYTHLRSVMVEVGQQLKAGKVIGHAGHKTDASESWVGLEVWHKGKSVDPASIMILE